MSSLPDPDPTSAGRWLGRGLGPRPGAATALNALSIGFGLAAVGSLPEAELALDGLWLTLAIGAFVFTVVVALIRIAVGAAFVILMMAQEASMTGIPMQIELTDLSEWPLLLAFSIIVTLMAHRVSTAAKRYAALYRHTSERLVSAQEVERGRLSRDLHDSVGQTLTAALLTLDLAHQDLEAVPEPTASARAAIRRAQDLTTRALEETRDVAAQLRPPRLTEIGLGAALRDLAASAGISAEIRFDPAILPPAMLPAQMELGAYRIVQEAVGNAARHSRARHVWIDAIVADRSIRLDVTDDGAGFDATSPRAGGMGLAGMEERAGVMDGQLHVTSDPGSGTRVSLVVPRSPQAVDARPAAMLEPEAVG